MLTLFPNTRQRSTLMMEVAFILKICVAMFSPTYKKFFFFLSFWLLGLCLSPSLVEANVSNFCLLQSGNQSGMPQHPPPGPPPHAQAPQ